MQTKRLMKEEVVDTFGSGQFEGTLRGTAEFINRLIETHGEDAVLSYEQHDRWDDTYFYAVMVSRPETDTEYEQRVATQKSLAEAEEARERKQLAALMQKYGGL